MISNFIDFHANRHLSAGLPLSWVLEQKDDYLAYLLKKQEVDFLFKGEQYKIRIGSFGKDTCFSLIFHKSRIEKLATITFLSRCSYSPLFMLPYSNVVPAPESHRSVASLLSSQSRIPFSGRYALVKLHGFTPPIFILSIRDKPKAP